MGGVLPAGCSGPLGPLKHFLLQRAKFWGEGSDGSWICSGRLNASLLMVTEMQAQRWLTTTTLLGAHKGQDRWVR